MTLPTAGLAILDFTAAWCGPCRQLAPVLVAIERDYKVPVVEIDVDAEPALAERFSVRSMPTLVLWRDGREVGRGVRARAMVAAPQVARGVLDDRHEHARDVRALAQIATREERVKRVLHDVERLGGGETLATGQRGELARVIARERGDVIGA